MVQTGRGGFSQLFPYISGSWSPGGRGFRRFRLLVNELLVNSLSEVAVGTRCSMQEVGSDGRLASQESVLRQFSYFHRTVELQSASSRWSASNSSLNFLLEKLIRGLLFDLSTKCYLSRSRKESLIFA